MTLDASCSFCGHQPTCAPSSALRVCRSCALRIADLALEPTGAIWVASAPRQDTTDAAPDSIEASDSEGIFEEFRQGVAKEATDDDAELRVDLAEAYCEMGLYADARREAARAVTSRSPMDTLEAALRILLEEPLLPGDGLIKIREELRRALN